MVSEYTKFGIKLKRIDINDYHLILDWRNSEDVRPYMQYQKIITLEEHLSWFYKIDNELNYYFIGYFNDEPFGVYNIKDVDFKENCGEGGLFLKDKSFWEGDVAIRGNFALADFCFNVLNLDYTYCHILKDNKKAINFNKQQGLVLDESFISETSIRMTLLSSDFYKKNKKLITYLSK